MICCLLCPPALCPPGKVNADSPRLLEPRRSGIRITPPIRREADIALALFRLISDTLRRELAACRLLISGLPQLWWQSRQLACMCLARAVARGQERPYHLFIGSHRFAHCRSGGVVGSPHGNLSGAFQVSCYGSCRSRAVAPSKAMPSPFCSVMHLYSISFLSCHLPDSSFQIIVPTPSAYPLRLPVDELRSSRVKSLLCPVQPQLHYLYHSSLLLQDGSPS